MDSLFKQAQRKFENGDYDGALVDFSTLLKKDPDNHEAYIAKARCQLALSHTDAASFSYQAILNYPKSPLPSQAEAQLFLGKYRRAQDLLKQFLNNEPHNSEASFLSALCNYKLGKISTCVNDLGKAVEEGFKWEDDEPVDFLVQHVLQGGDFNDFEQIYLDVWEAKLEGKENPQNRWFSINMPVYELFTASPDRQEPKLRQLESLLGLTPRSTSLEQSEDHLMEILRDFSRNQEDARFGLEAMKQLQDKHYPQVASLILAMQLEHLKNFGEYFGLEENTISNSPLQGLIPLLPHRIAVILMILYSASEPKDKIQKMALENLDRRILVHLLSICFSTFYHEINAYKQYQK